MINHAANSAGGDRSAAGAVVIDLLVVLVIVLVVVTVRIKSDDDGERLTTRSWRGPRPDDDGAPPQPITSSTPVGVPSLRFRLTRLSSPWLANVQNYRIDSLEELAHRHVQFPIPMPAAHPDEFGPHTRDDALADDDRYRLLRPYPVSSTDASSGARRRLAKYPGSNRL